MSKQYPIRIVAALVVFVAILCSPVDAGPFLAYSLDAAKEQLQKTGSLDEKKQTFFGITRPLAIVYDRLNNELIFVGQANANEPEIALDDLAVALRAVLKHKRAPLVSIDRTSETETTGNQRVRFAGGVENTSFGNGLLNADVVLKKLGLGILKANVWGIISYFDLSAAEWKNTGSDDLSHSRFWFLPGTNSFVAYRDGIAVVNSLKIDVRTELLGATKNGEPLRDLSAVQDASGEGFAFALTAGYEEISQYHSQLKRLDALFRLAGLAEGVNQLRLQYASFKPDMDFWLNKYPVASVSTPEVYELLSRSETLHRGCQVRKMTVEGGIELKALLLELNDGDVSAFRDIVLKSRPKTKPLAWKVPLEGWGISGMSPNEITKTFASSITPGDSQLGASLLRRFDPVDSGASSKTVFPNMRNDSHFFATSLFHVTDRLDSTRRFSNIGGVMLSGTAEIEGAEKAQVNLGGGCFSLVVDGKNARIDPKMYRKFITALWCVYYGDEDPGISIDPPWRDCEEENDPEKWKAGEKHSVRYIGRVLDTDLGRVMREADYLMKKWAVGTEQPNYPGFFSVDRYAAALGAECKGVPTRFWFVPESLAFKRGGDLLLFDGGRMQLNSEFDRDGMRGKASAADEKFAEFFSQHYNDIAAKNPIYRELFEYAKLVSLAKYLKQQGVPLHWFLMANKDLVLLEDSPREVDGLLHRSDYVDGLVVKGGVDLAAAPTCRYDAETAAAVENMMSRIPAAGMPATGMPGAAGKVQHMPMRFSFDIGSQSYSVVPQHTLISGKDHRGIRYQTDLALRENGRPGLELVRYYNPRNREKGEFGKGWRLLVPYRVKPAGEETREFLNAIIPKRMIVENLLTGRREALSFSEDEEAGAGYAPEKPSSSQVVRLFIMSDASYRLRDKLGSQFQFDQAGYLTDMVLSPGGGHHVHIDYADDFTAAFAKTPYVVHPVGNEKVAFLNAMVPKQVKVIDLVHGDSEVLAFRNTNRAPGYVPRDEDASRYRLLAILSNAGLQLHDKHGNQTVFDPAWKFRRMLPSREQRIASSISTGGQKVAFSYTINGSGEVIIAGSSLSANAPGAPITHVVRYEHDGEGRLCGVRRREVAKSAEYCGML